MESVSEYQTALGWKDFENIVGITEHNLVDGEPYTNDTDMEGVKVTYTRNFTSTNWQPLYLPFALSYDDWKDYADVAYVNNVHQWDDDEDGTIDRTILEFITKKSGSTAPNTPYVIKPKTTGEVTFTTGENTALKAAPATDGYVDCRSTTTEYIIYGTYQKKTDMYENGYYGMAGGAFKLAESASVILPPYRIYMEIKSRSGSGSVKATPRKVSLMVDGMVEDASGIAVIPGSESGAQTDGYNINGQRVTVRFKGIVLKNGKKVMVK